MKMQKLFTIDVELVQKLREEDNASAIVNDLLAKHYEPKLHKLETNELKHSIEELQEQERLLKEKIEEYKIVAEKKEDEQIKLDARKKLLEEAGLTPDKVKFLINMNPSIAVARETAAKWEEQFGEQRNWSDLVKLKMSYT